MRNIILILFAIDLLMCRLIAETAVASVCIEELCLRPKGEAPRWIELKNYSKQEIDISGWRLEDMDGVFFRFEGGESIKPGEIILLLFYRGSEADAEFEASIPQGVRKYTVHNIQPFSKSGVYKADEKDLEIHSIVYEKLGKDSENYLRQLLEERYDACKKQAEAVLKEKNYPAKYLFPLIQSIYMNLPERDEIALLDSNNQLVSYVNWQSRREIFSERDFRYENAAIEAGIWDESSKYFRSGGGISSGYEGYSQIILDKQSERRFYVSENGTPGFSTCQLPFQELELTYDSNNSQEKDSVILVLSYRPPIVKNRWGYEFEIASDSDFKDVLFNKTEDIGFSPTIRGRIFLEFKRTDYEDMILWHPELYYRARRVLPDGYKTEWAGGECGELLRKRYNGQKISKLVDEMGVLWDKRELLEERQKELRMEIEKLTSLLVKEKNKQKIEELKKKSEEKQKELEKVNAEHTRINEEYWKMKKEYRAKLNIKIPGQE